MLVSRGLYVYLEEHKSTVSVGGRPVTNLRFADDIDGLAGSQAELAELIRRLVWFGNECGKDQSDD